MRLKNCALVVLLAGWGCATAPARVDVLVGSAAPELERFAARELCDYLSKLYGIQAHPSRHATVDGEAVFLVGRPETNAAVRQALGEGGFGEITDQGLVLKRTRWEGTPALVVGGGSPRATLWAVYELVERWGVRYLTDRDALPQERREFQVPDLDVLMEPVFRIRAHPTIQDFAPSGEAWGMADFRVLIDQLAKLKFTRMNVYPFGYQPYLQWEHKGIQRRSASLWYEQHFPITPDMIGRELFEDAAEFWNPDLPLGGSYDELMAAGERQVHNLIEYAHRRGMECDIFAPTIDFPPEFAPLLKGAGRSGQLTVHPGFNTPIDDSSLSELSAAVLQATVDTYPEVDRIMVAMPEKRQWLGQYERAWRELDAKYGISQVRSLDDILAAAENRKGSRRWPGKRGLDQAKADIASLFFYDRLLLDGGVLGDTQRPDIQFVYMEPAEELYPLLDRILPSGWEVGAHPENQPEHFLPRAEVLGTLNTRKIPGIMHVTLDDDVVGLVPQLRPTVLHEFMTQLRRHGWTGFAARERFPADHDAVLAYLAEAGWNSEAEPDVVARDLIRTVCGEASVEDMLAALHLVESATLNLATNKINFSFYVPGMMMKFWNPEPKPAYLVELQQDYVQALEAARRALEKSRPEGRWYPDFWVGRIEFALGYANAVEAMGRGAAVEAAGKRAEAAKHADEALSLLRGGLEAYVRVARNRTDLGAIAVMNEFGYRALQRKRTELGN